MSATLMQPSESASAVLAREHAKTNGPGRVRPIMDFIGAGPASGLVLTTPTGAMAIPSIRVDLPAGAIKTRSSDVLAAISQLKRKCEVAPSPMSVTWYVSKTEAKRARLLVGALVKIVELEDVTVTSEAAGLQATVEAPGYLELAPDLAGGSTPKNFAANS